MKKKNSKKPGNSRPQNSKAKNHFPPGWDDQRVREVIDHYESLTDDERAAEIEAAAAAAGQTLVSVPTELVPEVVKLIKRRQRSA